MKIALAQINVTVGDIAGNRDKIIEQISIAITQQADLVVFGEMTITGTPLYDLVGTENFVENALFELSEIAEYTKGIDVLIGTPSNVETEVFNSVIHISKGEIASEFNKAMISSRDEMGYISGVESEYYEQESPLENIIEVNGERVFVAIGDDINFIGDLPCFTKYRRFSAVVHMEAVRYYHGVGYDKAQERAEQAKALKIPIISVNIVGGATDQVYYGGSTVVNEYGELIMQLNSFEEELAMIELEDLETFKPIKFKKLSSKGKSRETFNALVMAVRDYFHKRGFSKACLGLSGGVDSAVVAAVAVEALGAENVTGLLMPSQYSSSHSVKDAEKLAKNLGMKYHIIPIEESFNTLLKAITPAFEDKTFSVAEENMQSRTRGLLLMAYANKTGAILLNTSNKCEAAMGYGTLYGDTNGALSILGDLYKGEIYDLARYINADEDIIPQNTIDKAPSAELRPNQKDSDSLPEYDVLDKILYMLIEQCQSVEDIVATGIDMNTINKVATLLKHNEYKRYQLPPVVRVSAVTLGVERRMPI